MVPRLPPELWEAILARGGPLRLAPHVRADARAVAAVRAQRAWWRHDAQRRPLPTGTHVVVRASAGAPLRRGVVSPAGPHARIRLLDRDGAYLFLPHPSAKVRAVAGGGPPPRR
jgi:hypothetical protein